MLSFGAESFVFHFGINHLKIKEYGNLILLAVLYGCETWLFKLRGESRLRVFENRVLRRIFGPKRVEVTRQWRKLYNEGLNDLYFSPNIFRVIKLKIMRSVWHVARSRERRGV